MLVCWLVLQIVCDADPLLWAHIPMNIAMLFLNESLRNKHATSRQPEHTVTGLQYPKFCFSLYPHPAYYSRTCILQVIQQDFSGFLRDFETALHTEWASRSALSNLRHWHDYTYITDRPELLRENSTMPAFRSNRLSGSTTGPAFSVS